MYCQQCGAEYREGFVECSTCSLPLVEGQPPEPESDESRWTPEIKIGSEGTRLIFLYIAQIIVIVLAFAINWPGPEQYRAFRVLTVVLGLSSAISIFTRKSFALHLTYGFLAMYILLSALDIFDAAQAGGGGRGYQQTVHLSGLIGQIVGGIVLPVAWLYYFYRRRNLFGVVSSTNHTSILGE